MKIRVSMWSFLSVIHPLQIPIPMYKKKIWIQQEYCLGNQRKLSIFLRNNRVCMVVNPYKTKKRYTVTESLDIIVSVK